jgi:hypothetical protein
MSQPSRLQALTQQTTGFHRNVYILFVSFFFFGFLIFGGVFQVLVNLMMVRLGYEPEFVGLLNGVGLLFISIGSVVAAVLGQRFASTTLLKFGFFFFFLGFLLFPLGNYLSSEIQRGWYLGTYALGNLMTAIYLVQANPLIMASTNDAAR